MPVNYYLEDDQGRIYGPGVPTESGRGLCFDTKGVQGTRVVFFLARHDVENNNLHNFAYPASRQIHLDSRTESVVVTLPPAFRRIDEAMEKESRPAGEHRQDDLQNIWKMV